MPTLFTLLAALAACGGDGSDGDATATSTTSSEVPAVVVPSTGSKDSDPAAGSGTARIDGTEYSFDVSSCVVLNGRPTLTGSGEVGVVMQTSSLIIRIPADDEEIRAFGSTNLAVTLEGGTVNANGTGTDRSGAKRTFELSASPCKPVG